MVGRGGEKKKSGEKQERGLFFCRTQLHTHPAPLGGGASQESAEIDWFIWIGKVNPAPSPL